MEQIFKVGDRVFDYLYGWGVVLGVSKDNYDIDEYGTVRVMFDRGNRLSYYNLDGTKNFNVSSTLSFTEYTLDGFNQERPEELPNRGDIVWVRDADCEPWLVTHFMKKVGKKFYGSDSFSEDNMTFWFRLTTKNPYYHEQN